MTEDGWKETLRIGGQMTDEELLTNNAHIPTDEIEGDIAATEAEITTMEIEAAHLEATPLSLPDARIEHMRAAARRSGIARRREFIAKLRHLLALRAEAELRRSGYHRKG